MREEKIIIFLYAAVLRKWYECKVSTDSSFRLVLQQLRDAVQKEEGWRYDFEGDVRVYEFVKQTPCDLDISFHRLGVQNGMSFMIY